MDAAALNAYQMDSAGHQLRKVFEGIPEGNRTAKVAENAMTPAETLEHLCECYTAVKTEAAGGKYEWGSTVIEDKSWDNLMTTMTQLREEAVGSLRGSNDEKHLKLGVNFIVLHDTYHVGQLATLRLNTEPDWDSYSIYEG